MNWLRLQRLRLSIASDHQTAACVELWLQHAVGDIDHVVMEAMNGVPAMIGRATDHGRGMSSALAAWARG